MMARASVAVAPAPWEPVVRGFPAPFDRQWTANRVSGP